MACMEMTIWGGGMFWEPRIDGCVSVQIVNAPRQTGAPTAKSEYEVFYIDYGNQEMVPLSQLRPLDPAVASPVQGLATLCSLAHIRVPELEEDCGEEAAEFLSECVANKPLLMKVEERDTSGGKVKGKGTGPVSIVTLIDPESSRTIQSLMVEVRACGVVRDPVCWNVWVIGCDVWGRRFTGVDGGLGDAEWAGEAGEAEQVGWAGEEEGARGVGGVSDLGEEEPAQHVELR